MIKDHSFTGVLEVGHPAPDSLRDSSRVLALFYLFERQSNSSHNLIKMILFKKEKV